jgi:hypothetical protein
MLARPAPRTAGRRVSRLFSSISSNDPQDPHKAVVVVTSAAPRFERTRTRDVAAINVPDALQKVQNSTGMMPTPKVKDSQ